MGLSDTIARYIQDALEGSQGHVELRRAGVSQLFGCAPSQINYVIATRFTPEHGYHVVSRRGGGGYIRISRVLTGRGALIMHTVNALGWRVDPPTAAALLENLGTALSGEMCALMAAAVDDNALRPVPPEYRDQVRASILKRCLVQAAANFE